MSINMNGFVRGLMGDSGPGEAKTFELKSGQLVKGVVLQVSGDQEALVNISGVVVKARLEAPLQPGQVTTLQVQPETAGGQIVLKPLQQSQIRISDDSLADLIKNLGLKDLPVTREIIQTLHQSGIPLSKDTVQQLQQLARQLQQGLSVKDMLEAAVMALGRGLPLTQATLSSLHQAVAGKPLHETLRNLSEQVEAEFKGGKAVPESIRRPMELVRTVLRQIEQASAEGSSSTGETAADLRKTGASPRGMPGSEVVQTAKEAVQGRTAAAQQSATATGLRNQAEILNAGNVVRAEGTAAAAGASGEKAYSGAEKGSLEIATASAGTHAEGNPLKAVSSHTAAAPLAAKPGSQATAGIGEWGSRISVETTSSGGSSLIDSQSTEASINRGPTASPQAFTKQGATASLGASTNQGDSASVGGGKGPQASEVPTAVVPKSGSFTAGANIGLFTEGLRPSSGDNAAEAQIADPSAEKHSSSPLLAATNNSTPAPSDSVDSDSNAPRKAPNGQRSATAGQGSGSAKVRASDNSSREQSGWIERILKAVGLDHEQRVSRLPESSIPLSRTIVGDPNGSSYAGSAAFPIGGSDAEMKAVTDTLKSALLSLASSDDTPTVLKDASQQALQQVTGQQLLLSTDRSALFSHMTLFIPFLNDSGQQTAAVHIQSRKGSRGELDSDNCRLLFELRMKSMGDTLVDVQVVNKIVSLQIHNDHPAATAVLESFREEISEGLQSAGYRLLSLKCGPFPEPSSAKEGNQNDHRANEEERHPIDKSRFYTKPYKGVDLKI